MKNKKTNKPTKEKQTNKQTKQKSKQFCMGCTEKNLFWSYALD